MSTIALIQCTSKKKNYECIARELYSESPRFKRAYELATRVADRVYILSAKYGLIAEDKIIEPYNETLKDKTQHERQEWANQVLADLHRITDLKNDQFIILAGEVYIDYLIPEISHYWQPLKGKSIGYWIPELERLITLEEEKDTVRAIHGLFNSLPRLDWQVINSIPYENGIYIMFENGETYHELDRIVRVGTHTGQNNLRKRLNSHFNNGNRESSILRKNLGRAYLNGQQDSYLKIWNTKRHDASDDYDSVKEAELERKITEYLREHISFVCFPVEEKEERLRLEEGLISTLHQDGSFSPSSNWLGLNSSEYEIAASGLWNKQGLNGKKLSPEEMERIKYLARFGNGGGGIVKPPLRQTLSVPSPKYIGVTNSEENKVRVTANNVRTHIDSLFQTANEQRMEFIELISGDIHRNLGMKNAMPQVCRIMYEKMSPGDEVLHTTPSGKSSTIKIRYYLEKR